MSNCAFCSKHKYCKFEDGEHLSDCPTVNNRDMVNASQKEYLNGQYSDFMLQSLRQVAAGYEAVDNKPHPIKTRLEEIIDFCHRMGYQKLGLAFCTGLEDDAKVMAKVLRKNGFEVVSAICKVGGLKKEEVGLEDAGKIIPGRREISCNPLLQAELMNQAGTDFNIVFGLCLGHANKLGPAIYDADKYFIVPPITEPGYIDIILRKRADTPCNIKIVFSN